MRRAPWVIALAAGLVLTGCGIPDNTEVRPLRPGPSTGVSAGDDTAPARNLRADTQDPTQFVRNFLEAPAGDVEGAAERVKQFLSPAAAAAFKATEIRVVRLTESPLIEPGTDQVTINAQTVGTLGANGVLEPAGGRPDRYDMVIGGLEGQQGLFVTTAPPVLLLSVEALNKFYRQRTIYFWNRDYTGLVPDLRYMSLNLPTEQQPTEIIDWLTSGPSPLVEDVVHALPKDTKPIGNVPATSDGTLQISLSTQAVAPDDPVALDRLQKQLRWSLGPDLRGALELTVEQQFDRRRYTGTDHLASNPAYRQVAEPERFVVYGGRIHRLNRSYNANQPVPVIKPEANKGVVTAAVSYAGSRVWAALVVDESRGRKALWVGAAAPAQQADLRRIGGLPAQLGRPSWARSPQGSDAGTVGLIPAQGKLYRFRPGGASAAEVGWPGRPRGITAVAVAPDAHRVAVLAAGRLYVAALTGDEDGTQITEARPIATRLTGLTAVDWSSEGMLVVAGKQPDSNRSAITGVSIDGAIQTDRISDLGSNPVTHLAALPAGPTQSGTGAIAYVLNGVAYDEVNPDRIGVDDLAEPVADPPPGVLPSAPFFLN